MSVTDGAPDGVEVREMGIRNANGIHARPAALFVQLASRYDAEVTVDNEGNRVSGKSIMGMLTLNASCGTVLKVSAEGPDASELLDELEQLVESGFETG